MFFPHINRLLDLILILSPETNRSRVDIKERLAGAESQSSHKNKYIIRIPRAEGDVKGGEFNKNWTSVIKQVKVIIRTIKGRDHRDLYSRLTRQRAIEWKYLWLLKTG